MHILSTVGFFLFLGQLVLGFTPFANANAYENLPQAQAPSLQKFNTDQKEKPAFFEKKVLINPEIRELLSFKNQGGVVQNNSETLLTIKGILIILETSGKIKPNIKIDKGLPGTIQLGNVINANFGEIARLKTGFYSDQIYRVTLKPEFAANPEARSFVIKSVRWGGGKSPRAIRTRHQQTPVKEIQDLKRVEQIIFPTAIALKKNYPFFPTLAVAEDTFYYFNPLGEKQYIAVIPMALGDTAANILNEATLFDDEKEIDLTMERVGRALGEFHYHLATPEEQEKLKNPSYASFQTIVHGDFHGGNIFVGPQGVTFIDNASMADSINHPQSILVDIYRLFQTTNYSFLSFTLPLLQFKHLKSGFIAFAKGYAQAFPPEIQGKIEHFLMDTFKEIDLTIQNHFKDYFQFGSLPSLSKTDRNDKYWLTLYLTEQSIKYYLSQPGNNKEDLMPRIFLNVEPRSSQRNPNTAPASSNGSSPMYYYPSDDDSPVGHYPSDDSPVVHYPSNNSSPMYLYPPDDSSVGHYID